MSRYDLDISVFLDDPNSDPPIFRLECDDLPIMPGGSEHDFYFANRKGYGDGFLVRFVLQGDAHGYRFPDNPLDALYSKNGPGCPSNYGHSPRFVPTDVKSGNKILLVLNRNQERHMGKFSYTLRLSKSPHDENTPEAKILKLDPGGENGNGHGLAFNLNLAVLAIVIGVASALVTTTALVFLGFVG